MEAAPAVKQRFPNRVRKFDSCRGTLDNGTGSGGNAR
jgi:hypothetical protein